MNLSYSSAAAPAESVLGRKETGLLFIQCSFLSVPSPMTKHLCPDKINMLS